MRCRFGSATRMFPPPRRASAGLAVFIVPPNGAAWLLPRALGRRRGEAGGRLRRATMGFAGLTPSYKYSPAAPARPRSGWSRVLLGAVGAAHCVELQRHRRAEPYHVVRVVVVGVVGQRVDENVEALAVGHQPRQNILELRSRDHKPELRNRVRRRPPRLVGRVARSPRRRQVRGRTCLQMPF